MANRGPTLGSLLDARVDDFHSEFDEIKLIEGLLSRECRKTYSSEVMLDWVTPDDFWNPTAGRIWAKARDLRERNKPPTPRLLLPEEDDNFRRFVNSAEGQAPDPIWVAKAAEVVGDLSRKRRAFRVVYDMASFLGPETTVGEFAAFSEQRLGELSQIDDISDRDILPYLEALEEWQEWMEAPQDEVRTFPTPWPDINDKLSGGLHSGRTYVIAARSGFGKSLMLGNIISTAAEAGSPSLLYSVEMKSREVVSRIVSSQTEVEYGRITKRDLSDQDWYRVGMYIDNRAPDTKLWIADDPRMKIEEVFAKARDLKKREGLDIIGLDYLQIMQPSEKRESRERQVAHLSRMTQIMAKQLDVAVVLAAQLNRNGVTENRAPRQEDLRESDAIVHDADVVLMLHREIDETGMGDAEVEVHFVKNRTGPAGVIPLQWRPHRAKIGTF